MKKNITLKEHLDKGRKKAHETQKKNGHFKKMVDKREENRKRKSHDMVDPQDKSYITNPYGY